MTPSAAGYETRSFHLTLGGGLESLTLRRRVIPMPRAHEVIVKMHAVSLNSRELIIALRGVYPLPITPGVVAACDGAGEVVATGEGVAAVRVGDRVAASVFPDWLDGPFALTRAAQLGGSVDGTLTEYASFPERALVHLPPHLSFIEGAALPCAGVTAWNALTGGRPLVAGDVVLTLGSGSVSLFALQLAKCSGAYVIATTSSEEKAERLVALGADHVVDYRAEPQWGESVRRCTDDRGVDRVVEVGGATLTQSLRAVALGGEIALVGMLGGGPSTVDPYTIFTSGATIRPLAVGSRAQFEAMNRAVSTHGIRPVIDRVFPFAETGEALAYYASGRAFGKVMIQLVERTA